MPDLYTVKSLQKPTRIEIQEGQSSSIWFLFLFIQDFEIRFSEIF